MPNVDGSRYPLLFAEQTDWGTVNVRFELGDPPEDLVSNVNITPHVGDDWVIIRQERGWGIAGGTLEPGESMLDALERELMEEAGAQLVDFRVFGAFRVEATTDKPYRPHLPFPVAYRVVGVGAVELTDEPQNPPGGESILEVGTFPLDEACRRLSERGEDGPLLAELYRLAAEVRKDR